MMRIAGSVSTVRDLKAALAAMEDSLPVSFAGLDTLGLYLRWGIEGPTLVVDEPHRDEVLDDDD